MATTKSLLKAVLESEAKRLHEDVCVRGQTLSGDDARKLKVLVEIQNLLESDAEQEPSPEASVDELIEAAGLGQSKPSSEVL